MTKRSCITASAILLVLGATMAEAQNPQPLFELEACHVALQGPGLTARFADTAVYELTVTSDGRVEAVHSVRAPQLRDFVDLASFEQCLKRWRLRPSVKYTVRFRFGTADDLLSRWLIDVSEGDRAVIRLVLPRVRESASANKALNPTSATWHDEVALAG